VPATELGADQCRHLPPKGRVEAGVVVRGRLWVGPRSVVRQGAICEGDVMLGADVRLEDYAKVENCVIGDGSVVSHCAEVLGGVLMRNVWLMHHCELYGVLGDDVDIGAATVCGTLRFDDGETAHRVGGRWETPSIGANAAYLGDHVRTGVNVTILPGRHVGPFSAVGPGIVVAEDVPEGTLVTLRQELDRRPFGPDRYGW
jgi:bifunctional UDP-N-acetylglucosamine pyrophosphorylase/glucosamine-1-phosphate N-acetyltransferase